MNDPELSGMPALEFIPQTIASVQPVEIKLQDALVTALQHRPEITQSAKELRRTKCAGCFLNTNCDRC